MKTPSLLPFLSKKDPGVRVFCFYGSRTDVLSWRLYAVHKILTLTHPGIKVSCVTQIPSPAPSLWGPPAGGTLYHLEKTPTPKEMPCLLALDAHTLFTHGSLTSKSPLLKEFETNPRVAFIACYDINFSEIERFITFLKEDMPFEFTPDAITLLRTLAIDHLELFPDLFDKLLLLKLPHIHKGDLEALFPCDHPQKNHAFLEAFLSPDRNAFIQRVSAFSAKQDNSFLLMRQLLGVVKQFHGAFTRIGNNCSGTQALKNQRYPLFFGRETVLSQALSRHTNLSISTLLEIFWDMEKDQKSDTPGLFVRERKLLMAHTVFHFGQEAVKALALAPKKYETR